MRFSKIMKKAFRSPIHTYQIYIVHCPFTRAAGSLNPSSGLHGFFRIFVPFLPACGPSSRVCLRVCVPQGRAVGSAVTGESTAPVFSSVARYSHSQSVARLELSRRAASRGQARRSVNMLKKRTALPPAGQSWSSGSMCAAAV